MASFPSAVVAYTLKENYTDTIMADHVNSLQNEVIAIQTALGVGATSILTSNWSYAPTSEVTTSWTTLGERLQNLETGLKNYGGFVPHPFLLAGM